MADESADRYSLTGPERAKAIAAGLAGAEWYRAPIPRAEMKALMQRSDGPALRDTLLWILLLAASGVIAYESWGTWWAVPAFAIYGILFASCGDSRQHECFHGTAFRTQWLNTVIHQVASFMMLRQARIHRWSHARHHTDTLIVGRDPEIEVKRPPSLPGILLDLVYLRDGLRQFRAIVGNALGRLSADDADYVPEGERWKAVLEARIYVAIFAAVAVWCIAVGSILPAMLIVFPAFFGAWVDLILFGYAQHAGLQENVLDHRLNTRTFYLNPVGRFIYWNMNYHLEHHMFPMVPYHALPRLHERMKADSPAPYPMLWAAWREILPALLRQAREPSHFVRRPLQPGARPTPAMPGLIEIHQ
jgi:fatty acid desaturase